MWRLLPKGRRLRKVELLIRRPPRGIRLLPKGRRLRKVELLIRRPPRGIREINFSLITKLI